MPEKDLERQYKQLIRKLGGRTYKWISPGIRGVPDQITFLAGQVFAVELKVKHGKLSALQRIIHRELAQQGILVCVIYGEHGLQKIGGYLYELQQRFIRDQKDQGIKSQTKSIKVFR